MSGLELALVVAAVVWLSLLTFVILLLVRQIGLITVRLDRERDDARPVSDGLEMGSEVPAQVAELIEPGEAESPAFVLVLAAICNPCRDLLEGLDGFAPRSPIVALVSGPEAPARALAETIPPYITAVRDPEADRAIRALEIGTTPFVFEVRANRVAAKAALRGADHFIRFVREAETVTTTELWRGVDVHVRSGDA